ncbi:MAG TPA: PrsW family intramembrane metalloprotease [Rubrobacteraceae bacterium]|nr:PrsW family intramembrane metalloprotease [Rubrobacteraceae bacterium]
MSGALVAIGMAQAVVYLLFIRFVDLYEREPLWYVIPVFIWGFAVATTASLFFNTIAAITISTIASTQAADTLTAIFVAPVVEESFKGLALIIVFLVALMLRRRGAMEYSGVMDGIVYGSAVGFGFAIAEDLIYYAQYGAEVFVVRRLFGGFAHAAFTSLTGVGIGLIPWVRSGLLKVALPLVGLVCAMLLHATFNFTATVFGSVAYLLLLCVIAAYLVLIAIWLAVERRTIRDELRDEVGFGTISQEEYGILPTYFRRTAYYLGLMLRGRFGTWRTARKVHNAAVDLAFTKRLTRRSWSASGESRVDELRGRIRALRGPAAAMRT